MVFNIVIWIVVLLLVGFPVCLSLKELRDRHREGSLATDWFLTVRQVAGLMIAGLLVFYSVTHQTGAALLSFILYFLVIGFSFWREAGDDGGNGKEKVRRGSRVVEAAQLNAMTSGKGNGSGNGKTKAGSAAQTNSDSAICIGGVTIPRALEAQHFLISGTTGSGKTQVINAMLRTIRQRGQRAIIADAGGGFFARFGKTGDVLINPFDQRSAAWSPFAEIRADYDCDRIAKAIIPDLDSGESAQWQLFAQVLLAKALLAMHRNQERSLKRLLYWMGAADQKALEPLLAGTPAAVLCQKGNDKMLNNMRATMMPYLSVFDYMADEGDFSIRQWVQEDWKQDWLFLTYRDDQMGMLKNLVAACLEMAIVEGLSLSEDQDRGLWYAFDELDSLGKISSLRAALTKLRKYGGRCILGIQTISQLRSTYGRNEAQTLLACTSVKCILRAGDSETAKSMEQELGEQEIERTHISETSGDSFNESTSTQIVRQSAVLSSELTGLPDLQGYLKIPGDEIAKIRIKYVKMDDVNQAFVHQ
jgi:type IV secretory pathway TraG/TraD family ATPase VirD4